MKNKKIIPTLVEQAFVFIEDEKESQNSYAKL